MTIHKNIYFTSIYESVQAKECAVLVLLSLVWRGGKGKIMKSIVGKVITNPVNTPHATQGTGIRYGPTEKPFVRSHQVS